MQNPRIDLPSRPRLQPIRPRMEQDPVVALVPVRQALTNLLLRRARLQTHECVRKVVLSGCTAAGSSTPPACPLAGRLCDRIVLVHVVRNGAQIVEKLAQDVPPALALITSAPKQQIACGSHRAFNRKRAPPDAY